MNTTYLYDKAVFAGGCFWCLEAAFQRVKSVLEVISGYAGGHTKNPTYYDVSEGLSGHAEVVELAFNPDEISYETLLEMFFVLHDPTSLNKQGNDIGTQYRSAIYPTSETQMLTAQKFLEAKKSLFSKPIVTELAPLDTFYPAEKYHKNYFNSHQGNPYCSLIIGPKLQDFALKFEAYLK